MRGISRRRVLSCILFLPSLLLGACHSSKEKKASRWLELAPLKELQGKRRLPLELYGLVLVLDEQGVFAMSLFCTHMRCLLSEQEAGYRCPCHGARFSEAGKLRAGPATRDLPRYRLKINADNVLEVKLGEEVSSDYRLPV